MARSRGDGHATKPPTLQNLPDDIILKIRDYIQPNPDRIVPVDKREFLSRESFDVSPLSPSPSSREVIREICRFRCACRRFADIGAPLLFTKVSTRFSKQGFQRLDGLTEWPHLTRHVRKFTYLVPYFYTQIENGFRFHLPDTGEATIRFDLSNVRRKIAEQVEIVQSEEDVRVLKKAIALFTSLQQVQLLRVVDMQDSDLYHFIRQHDLHRQFVGLDWAPACLRASRTIGEALLHSDLASVRFSSPMLDPQSAEFLSAHRPRSLPTLAARLTSLDLHFEEGNDLDHKMSELSSLFRTVFTSAVNLQNVYLGFPYRRPLSLPLEDVFHDMTWSKLVTFSIQSWRLHAHEVVDLALRHRNGLRGLRLRQVLLKQGSMWKDVLVTLRDSMYSLQWVSLRWIGYAETFDREPGGAEVHDDLGPGDSGSEEDEEDNVEAGPSTFQNGTNGHYNIDMDEDDEDDFSLDSDSDLEHGPEETNDTSFPDLETAGTPPSATFCNCNENTYSTSADALRDDGIRVDYRQRKAWEKWVLRRCPEHDTQQS